MEEKELQKVLAFDTLFTTNQLQMLKIIITYLAPSIQKSLAIYIKFMEFQYTLSFFQKHPNAYVQQLRKEEKLDTIKLCDEILPLCNPDEQAKVKQMRSMVNNWEQMQEMLQMLQMMQELFPEGTPFEPGGGEENNPLKQLFGMSGMDFSQITNLFQN